jgi:hypothetical protein
MRFMTASRTSTLVLVSSLLGFQAISSANAAVTPTAPAVPTATVVATAANAPTAYLIQTKSTTPGDLAHKVTAAGGTLVREQAEIGIAEATSEAPDFAAKLAADTDVAAVTRDPLVQWIPAPNAVSSIRVSLPTATKTAIASISVPPSAGKAAAAGAAAPAATNLAGAALLACQWGLSQIGVPAAWAQGAFGSPSLQVAVLDSGIDSTHIDLAGKVDVAHSASFVTAGSSPCGAADEGTADDRYFHGTFVASLIAGNGIGLAGVAPQAGLVAVKVLNCSGSGSFGDLVAGIHYAATLPNVDVINMSLGALVSRQDSGPLAAAVAKAVDFATSRGKLVVVAAGNNGITLDRDGDQIAVPAESGAVAQNLAGDSNRGLKTWVSAPGGELPNPAAALAGCPLAAQYQSLTLGACASAFCGSNSQYILGAGTAYAAPLVAGLAELADAARGGNTPPATLKAALVASGAGAAAAAANPAAAQTGIPPRIDAMTTLGAVTGNATPAGAPAASATSAAAPAPSH